MAACEKNISEPWFSLIKLKIKIVEGRLNKDYFTTLQKGDIITFVNYEFGFKRKLNVKVVDISHYNTFRSYLQTQGLDFCLPGIDTIEEGLNIYYKYYNINDEKIYKIKAFTIEVIDDYIHTEKKNKIK